MNQQSSVRAIIFDMDGVLTDSEPLINAAAVAMFAELGLRVQPEDFLPFVGTGEDRYIGGVAEKYQFPINLPTAKKRTYEIYLDLVPQRLQAFKGAVELVRECRRNGFRVAVASSADRIKIDANLRQIGLPPQEWDAVISAEDATLKKPAPDLFLAAAARLSLHPTHCTVIEDAVNGVQAAKAAGMRCVAVAQTFPPEKLQAADLVRPNIAEVTMADLAGLTPPLVSTDSAAALASPPLLTEAAPAAPGRPWGPWATAGLSILIQLAIFVAQLAVVFVMIAVSHVIGRKAAPNPETSGLVLSLAAWAAVPVAIGLSCLLASFRKGISVRAYLGLNPVSIKSLVAWCGLLVVFIVASDLLTYALGKPIVPESMQQAYASATFLPLFWLALIVAAPLAEETVFRGFFFKGLRHSRVGAAGAIIIPALIWSAIHVQYDLYGMGSIFVAGLLLGIARLRTDSLYTPLVMHGFMNVVATTETALRVGMSS